MCQWQQGGIRLRRIGGPAVNGVVIIAYFSNQFAVAMTPLFKKLNYKAQKVIVCLNPPPSFRKELEEMKPLATVVADASEMGETEFAIAFATTQTALDEAVRKLTPKLKGDAVLWLCYPKSASKKYRCDFNRDTGWRVLGEEGFEGVRQVAIDEDWSALRFRKSAYIRSLTRHESRAMTTDAKSRTTGKREVSS